MDYKNIKALLRKGKALYLGEDFEDAITTFTTAQEFYPKDTEVILELGFARKA